MSERDPRELLAALSSALELKTNVSDRSTPGVYIMLTRSGAVYIADIHDPDATPTVTRYAGGAANALRDGQPLPGVHGFSFNAWTGLGALIWWKDPTEYTDPSLPYVGTTRSTSRVLLIARLKDATTVGQERAVSMLHQLIRALRDPDLDYPALVARPYIDEE
ncbi:hypothetical protein [Microbacterium paraoxydans]|uniref:Uncharacterized protein n=1 Tax=Microbacterium paraoxydans TaxID=199592 RepID=A0A1H1X1E7_9MICO|nr:hypothetical protein [Microbacterium paraoxydans]SDT03154.1 hypothetical protein SAMN04489809_3325 [Microbacterium paraoxydans]